MNHLIGKLSDHVAETVKGGSLDTQKFLELQKVDGWKTYFSYLLFLRGLMAEDVLSERFTQLSRDEKDTIQRAYAMVDQLILFLMDPLAKARKMSVYSQHNIKMEATLREATGKRH